MIGSKLGLFGHIRRRIKKLMVRRMEGVNRREKTSYGLAGQYHRMEQTSLQELSQAAMDRQS